MCWRGLFLALASLSLQAVQALDKDKLDQLTELMVTGCSLGQSITIEVEGDGGISFWKKGVKGKFKASKDEIPAVIKFLETDETTRAVSNDTRECMKRYMDRIFDAILGSATSQSPASSAIAPRSQVVEGFSVDNSGFVVTPGGNRICRNEQVRYAPVYNGGTVFTTYRDLTLCKLYDGTWVEPPSAK